MNEMLLMRLALARTRLLEIPGEHLSCGDYMPYMASAAVLLTAVLPDISEDQVEEWAQSQEEGRAELPPLRETAGGKSGSYETSFKGMAGGAFGSCGMPFLKGVAPELCKIPDFTYRGSFADPARCRERFGEEMGNLLAALYGGLLFAYDAAAAGDYETAASLAELFLEIYGSFAEQDVPACGSVRMTLRSFRADYLDYHMERLLACQSFPEGEDAAACARGVLAPCCVPHLAGDPSYAEDHALDLAIYLDQPFVSASLRHLQELLSVSEAAGKRPDENRGKKQDADKDKRLEADRDKRPEADGENLQEAGKRAFLLTDRVEALRLEGLGGDQKKLYKTMITEGAAIWARRSKLQ